MKAIQIIDKRGMTQDIKLENGAWIETHGDDTATDSEGNTWRFNNDKNEWEATNKESVETTDNKITRLINHFVAGDITKEELAGMIAKTVCNENK